MILSSRPYSAKLRKLRRRLRDHKFFRPWIAASTNAFWWRRGDDKGRKRPRSCP